jgi:hypothetical protein
MISSLSAANLKIEDIFSHYNDLTRALHLHFSPGNPQYATEFADESVIAVRSRYEERLGELELSYSLTLLASVEAYFMVDYVLRCKLRKKDAVSQALRGIFRRKQERANLIDDILLKGWNKNAAVPPRLLNEMIRAFDLRHWLAHGRWWVLKVGRPAFDFVSVYNLALQILATFPLEGVS